MASMTAPADLLPPTDFAHLSDEQLVTRFRASNCGNSAGELVNRHVRHIRSIIFPMVLNHAVADDLTQETFLRAWRGLVGFRAEASFSTWLTRIAWNTVQDELARREQLPANLPVDQPKRLEGCPTAELLNRELDEQITTALAELSPKLRAAIVLTGLEQIPPQDAAEMEVCTLSTMYWRIHEARRLLQHRLAEYLGS
jgi:RNA polymerase sigma-70 factor (ECF subfamily)